MTGDWRGSDSPVYAPAEDSLLLAEAAVDSVTAGDRVIDVGTGSGFVARRLRAATRSDVIGVDVNPHACRAARRGTMAGVDGGPTADDRPLPVVRGHLLAPFPSGIADWVTFNPPYLPTPATGAPDADGRAATDGPPGGAEERGHGTGTAGASRDWQRVALAGGTSGRALIAPFLADLDRVLTPGGRALLLASTLTDLDRVAELAADAGFGTRVVAEASFPFERLVVWELRPET